MGTGKTYPKPKQFDDRSPPGGLVFRRFEPHHVNGAESTPVVLSPPTYQSFRILANSPLMLEGSATATYTKNVATSTTPATYELTGTIQLHGFGKLDLSGTIDADPKHATGQLSLSTNTGTIALDLRHVGKLAPGAFPKEMYFTVTHATGAYSHADGEGIISFSTTSTGSISGTVSMSLM